ncbi:6421_t:CDS:1 [Funneliformis caledonium]|uniref:6421_t:CDS:1 n=1 Tax=Funneliformis caledonium TaxID=1117310 RepID=A0A9N9BQA8_9GLOM|nr:6421_t:CDS:1 [Funneliformis caledonium]
MTCQQLSAKCLNNVLEYFENDKISLHSYLLVNHLWCQTSVKILWRNIWGFRYNLLSKPYQTHVPSAILGTLIACLPDESRDLLYANGIFIPTPTSKPPLFNYISFSEVLSIRKINQIIDESLTNQRIDTSRSLNYNKYLLSQELLKAFMNHVSSLKSLDYGLELLEKVQNVPFIYFPGAKDCLTDLSLLICDSDIESEFFYQFSQICRNIRTLSIIFRNNVSKGLKELISLQRNLEHLELSASNSQAWIEIIPALEKHSKTLTTLHIHGDIIPLTFINLFKNLKELVVPNSNQIFNELQYVTIPKLRSLRISTFFDPAYIIFSEIMRDDLLVKFLENNGKHLNELYIDSINKSLKLSIARFCPNLKNLYIIFKNNELNLLKSIFYNCQHLESIKIWRGGNYINEKEMLEVFAKHSPKSFHELKIHNRVQSELLPRDLRSFLKSWSNRIPQKPLTLIIENYDDDYGLDVNEENIQIIEKFKTLGVIKKFRIEKFDEKD